MPEGNPQDWVWDVCAGMDDKEGIPTVAGEEVEPEDHEMPWTLQAAVSSEEDAGDRANNNSTGTNGIAV